MASRLTELRSRSQAAQNPGTTCDKSTSPQVHNEAPPPYKRRTYHLRPDQIEGIESAAFHRKLDISEIVRRAIDAYLESETGVHK